MQKTQILSKQEVSELKKVMPFFEKFYKEVIEEVGPLINMVASFLPKRRERVQHTGLYGYSRGVGKVKLPRAIGFTASFYSIGVPPEFIGTGRGLKKCHDLNKLTLVIKHYRYIKEDLIEAVRYLNKDNLIRLSKKSKVWGKVVEDINQIEQILNITLGPKREQDFQHKKLTDKIYMQINASQDPSAFILKAALIRQSLG